MLVHPELTSSNTRNGHTSTALLLLTIPSDLSTVTEGGLGSALVDGTVGRAVILNAQLCRGCLFLHSEQCWDRHPLYETRQSPPALPIPTAPNCTQFQTIARQNYSRRAGARRGPSQVRGQNSDSARLAVVVTPPTGERFILPVTKNALGEPRFRCPEPGSCG
jgi:hypothetical protein